jgi:hypothetical protein
MLPGDYTIAKAGEPVWYQVRSATLAGRLRITGGDLYEVLFEAAPGRKSRRVTWICPLFSGNFHGVYHLVMTNIAMV